MALKHTCIYGSLLAITALSSVANAQTAQLHTPSATFEHRAIETPDATAPMATPGVFNYDAQMFAPFEFTSDKQKKPNCGFFFTIDKTLTSVSRSDRKGTSRLAVPIGSDWNWGERYQLGLMTEEGSGWHASYQRTEGVYYAQGFMDDSFRFLGFLPDGSTTAGEGLQGFGPRLLTFADGTADIGPEPFGFADSFRNQFHIGELNRVFRQELKNGDYFEPYIGGRYTNVNDASLQDAVYNYIGDDAQAPPGVDQTAHRFRQTTSNSALGFQLGGRHFRRRGRWLWSTDSAIAASYNHQRYTSSDIFFLDNESPLLVERYYEENSFLPTIDLELGLSFNVTRDLTIRGGAQLIYIWQGIARVNTLPGAENPNSIATDPDLREFRFVSNPDSFQFEGRDPLPDLGVAGITDENYTAAGFTFGVEWKR